MSNRRGGGIGSYSLTFFLGMTMLAWAGAPDQASAAMFDLTQASSSGGINGALYQATSTQSAGSGYGAFNAFLKISSNKPVEEGYNTDYRYPSGNGQKSVEFDQITDHHTRALKLSALPQVTIGDSSYREFLLDINEPQCKDNFLSLDALQIFIGDGPNLHDFSKDRDPNYAWAAHATLIYNMDAGGDNWAKLKDLGGGSGWADYSVYLRNDLFVGGEYVYLYSKFGENLDNHNGFEEWGVRTTPTPIPGSVFLLGTGLLGFAGTIRRKN